MLWTRGVDLDIFHPMDSKVLNTARPIFLYVGRVAVEKNVEAFLKLDLPGSKWVAGEGPALAELKSRYPQANYLGVLTQAELAKVYAAADVFVFPSRTDTFGLVLLEALACGTPVAAYPVTGPIDVLGDGGAGAMHEDLREACLEALEDRSQPCARVGRTLLVGGGLRAVRRASEAAAARVVSRGKRRRVTRRAEPSMRTRPSTVARARRTARCAPSMPTTTHAEHRTVRRRERARRAESCGSRAWFERHERRERRERHATNGTQHDTQHEPLSPDDPLAPLPFNPYKGNRGLTRAWHAMKNSLAGFRVAIREESAFRQELTLAAILIPCGVLVPVEPVSRVLLLGSVLLVLIVELLNSSVEAAIDRISLERHELSRRAKDLGSAAVMVALGMCLMTWVLIVGPLVVHWVKAWL